MAIGTTTAALTGSFDADKPLVLANHALREGPPTVAKWTAGGTTAEADITSSVWPISRAYDGHTHNRPTQPDAGATTRYVNFQIPASTIDAVVIQGSNLGTVGVTVEIDDDAAFGSPTTVATWTPADLGFQRLSNFDLGGNRTQYTDVIYLRVKFEHGSSVRPYLNEVFIGQSRQLQYHPHVPYGNLSEESSVSDFESDSGVTTDYVRYTGRAIREGLTFDIPDATELATWQAIWEDTHKGSRKFYWVETPSSDPKPYFMQMRDKVFNPVLSGPYYRSLKTSFRECHPFLGSE